MHETGMIIAHCEICKKGFHTKSKASQCRRQHIRSGNFKICDEISNGDEIDPTAQPPNTAPNITPSSLSALLLDNH